MILLIDLAHFQNGEISDEFAENLDICLARDTQATDDGSAPVLLAISDSNVYDGHIGKGYPTDLKRKFLAVRKKDSEEVRVCVSQYCFHCFESNLIFFFS